jgi:hypothetical protein
MYSLDIIQEDVELDISLMRESTPSRRYVNHIVLANFVCESSSCFEEVRCDALLEENYVWVTIPFWRPMIDSNTT